VLPSVLGIDEPHALLTAEGARHGNVVDLTAGARTPSPLGLATRCPPTGGIGGRARRQLGHGSAAQVSVTE